MQIAIEGNRQTAHAVFLRDFNPKVQHKPTNAPSHQSSKRVRDLLRAHALRMVARGILEYPASARIRAAWLAHRPFVPSVEFDPSPLRQLLEIMAELQLRRLQFAQRRLASTFIAIDPMSA
jgi:hypothetical protein